ncbi:MAG: hypothetical protein ACM3XM_14245 [Mycobacterium leprae]
MRVDRSAVSFASTHGLIKARQKSEKLTVQVGDRTNQNRPSAPPQRAPGVEPALPTSGISSVNPADDPTARLSPEDRVRIMLLERVLGIKIRILRPDRSEPQPVTVEGTAGPPRVGWSAVYESKEQYVEAEQLSFAARGVIRTADGEEIAFQFAVNLSREFRSENSLTLRLGDPPKDPLVINYGGPAADLVAGATFQFDLDSDGHADLMPVLQQGSGFLALDQNADGIINDGGELFGPASGNGFTELSQYDQDRNQWIDENDPIYQDLRIWTRDAEGHNQLFALGALGVGAIYLGTVSAPFTLKDGANQTTAQSRQMSLYAKADKSGVGIVQQLDVVIK